MDKALNLDSPAVHTYLTLLQSVIGRMASNSAAAKTWCTGLASGIVVVIDRQDLGDVWITLVPIVLFFLMDAYYMGLEKLFRDRYDDFIGKLHEEKTEVKDVFVITPDGDHAVSMKTVFDGCCSVSVWPFYVLLTLLLLGVQKWVL